MRRGLTAVIVLLFIAIILLLVLDVRKQLENLSFATSDNVQWFLSQSETEALALELAAQRAVHAQDPDIANLQLRFDIFYSRIDTLRSSPAFEPLQNSPRVQAEMAELEQFLADWVPTIDAADDRFENALPEFAEQTTAIRNATRNVALAGIGIFSEIRDAQRRSISQTLMRIAIMTIALVTVLIIVVLAMFRLAQIREQDAQTNLEISERMEAIIATALDAVVVTDRDGRIVEYNGAAEDMFGHPRDAALGENIVDLIIPTDTRQSHREGLARYHRDGMINLPIVSNPRAAGTGIVQIQAQDSEGRVFPVDITLARTHSREGEIFVSFIRDISTRVRAEEAMRDARDRAIAGEKQKADLLAVMSHEMRTPLNGMLGTLDLFQPDELSEEHQHYLDVMRKSGQILLNHVNDVLDVSRLDAGKMTMQRKRFDLIDLLNEIIEGQAGRARERGNTLILPPMRPELHEAYSDPDRLRQILLNLVGNAIKFTKDGEIIIEVECHDGLSDVEIRVIDTGLGISHENLDRIFGDFVTIDSSYGRSNHGTGLGLGISQRLIAALDGDMGAESELGDGSVFWLRLSLAPPAQQEQAPTRSPSKPAADAGDDAEAAALPPMSVLLVEDNPTNRMVARSLLERDGHSVVEAVDGAEGVEKANSGHFDMILMDISMPGMDGITATSKIRQDDPDTPIIATTAHAMPSEAARFIGAGMTSVLVKPVSRNTLRKALIAAKTPENLTITAPPASGEVLIRQQFDELISELPPAQAAQLIATFRLEMAAFLDVFGEPAPGAPKALRDEAHRLAGSAGVFGAAQLNITLRQIQTAAEQDPDAVPELLTDLQAVWDATEAEILATGIDAPAPTASV